MTASTNTAASATGANTSTAVATSSGTAAAFTHVLEICSLVDQYRKHGRDGKIRSRVQSRQGYCRCCKQKTQYFCNSCEDTLGAKLAWYCNASDCKKGLEKYVMGRTRNSTSST